jgi:hypothetical protein
VVRVTRQQVPRLHQIGGGGPVVFRRHIGIAIDSDTMPMRPCALRSNLLT